MCHAEDCVHEYDPSEPTSHIDNEYSRAGIQDPKLVITTSRDPSSKLLQFSNVISSEELRLSYLNCWYYNRKCASFFLTQLD